MKLLSIIIPVYNDKKSIVPFCHQMIHTMKESNDNYECIFIENGSHDNTLTQLRHICNEDYHFHYLSLRHNISLIEAFYLGTQYAKGDYILCMDLLHPVHMIPEFYTIISTRALPRVGGLLQDGIGSAKKQRFFKIFDKDVLNPYLIEGDFDGFKNQLFHENETIFWISYSNLEQRELTNMEQILRFLNIRYELSTIYFFVLLLLVMIVIVPSVLILHFDLDVHYSYYICLLFIFCIFAIIEILRLQFSRFQVHHHMEQIKDTTFH